MDIYHTSELQLLRFQGSKPRLREQSWQSRDSTCTTTRRIWFYNVCVCVWTEWVAAQVDSTHAFRPTQQGPHVLRSLTGMKSDSTCSSAKQCTDDIKEHATRIYPTAPAAQTTAAAATSTITLTTSQSHNHIHNHQLLQQAVLSTTITEKATSLLNPADSNFLAEHQVPRQRGYLVFHTHSP